MDLKEKIAQYVASWKRKGYPDGLPDEAPSRLEDLGKVGSYRLICIALVKNDKNLETLGFTRRPCQAYQELKRDELRTRGESLRPWQPSLF